jgi:hypothetical protein
MQVCFDRNQEMQIMRFRGFAPFGVRDAQIRKETLSGQNQDPRNVLPVLDAGPTGAQAQAPGTGNSGGGAGGGGAPPPPPPPPPDIPSGPTVLTINVSNTFGGGAVDRSVGIDIESGSVRGFATAFATAADAQAGEDVLISTNGGSLLFEAVNGARIFNCGTANPAIAQSVQVTQIVDASVVGTGGFQGQYSNPPNGGIGSVMAVRTGGGTYALFDQGSLAQITMFRDDDPVFFAGGTLPCQ